ncbi:protein FRA10AC1-like isoform X1 [Triticum dicoccoides]|uniref:protein FRA10AC1-like isoform X1 n=1 Tax=Triticum dicoccoides TaxID=85692 RepID=UPI0018917F54|nr:protein FRA10AC1-like isoform X1 [Triticum dicoccoides]
MASLGRLKSAIFDREERKMQYQSHIQGLNAYDRHKKFMKDYVQFYGHQKNVDNSLPIKTDKDTLREGYRFILSEEDDMDSTWEKRLVKRYYDKLFKEYCIADMTQYKKCKACTLVTQKRTTINDMAVVHFQWQDDEWMPNQFFFLLKSSVVLDMNPILQGYILLQIGLRWRTEKEVISGKGQFICGSRHCDEKHGLGSYEVNFSYVEAGEQKQALVKLVACKRCAEKLAYKRLKEKEKEKEGDPYGEKEIKLKDRDKRKREHEESDDTSEDEAKKDRRKKKDRKGASSRSSGNNGEGFEEFLEGMFP